MHPRARVPLVSSQTADGKDYELLNSHYYFPSNKATTDGQYRMLTYKKMMDAEWNGVSICSSTISLEQNIAVLSGAFEAASPQGSPQALSCCT